MKMIFNKNVEIIINGSRNQGIILRAIKVKEYGKERI